MENEVLHTAKPPAILQAPRAICHCFSLGGRLQTGLSMDPGVQIAQAQPCFTYTRRNIRVCCVPGSRAAPQPRCCPQPHLHLPRELPKHRCPTGSAHPMIDGSCSSLTWRCQQRSFAVAFCIFPSPQDRLCTPKLPKRRHLGTLPLLAWWLWPPGRQENP